MERLNEDARFEVFDAIAEFIDDGVFVLMSVCMQWQDQVCRSPRLWRYITFSGIIGDFEAKLDTQLLMSQDLPLVVRVHFPLASMRPLSSVLHRKIADLVIINNWPNQYRDNIFITLCKILSAYPQHQIKEVMWRDSAGNSPHVPERAFKQIYDRLCLGDIELQSVLHVYPPLLLTKLDISASMMPNTPEDETRKIFPEVFISCIRHLTHLVSLTVDHNLFMDTVVGVRDNLRLPRLQDMQVIFSKYYNSFPATLVTPNLRRLTLHGTWEQSCAYLSVSECRLQLEVLTIDITSDSRRVTFQRDYQNLSRHRHTAHDLTVIMRLTATPMSARSEKFAFFLKLLTSSLAIGRVRASMPSQYAVLLHGLRLNHPLHTIQLTTGSWHSVRGLPNLQAFCDTLILTSPSGKPSLHQLPRPKKLIISTRQFSFSDLPGSWIPTLEEARIDVTSDPRQKIYTPLPTTSHSFWNFPIPFASLRCLKCQVHTAVALLASEHRLSALEELWVKKMDYNIGQEVNRLLELLSMTMCAANRYQEFQQALPMLNTLGLDWFPEWSHIRDFMERWVESRGLYITLTLKLPKRPARRLLRAIVQMLRGTTPDFVPTYAAHSDFMTECQDCACAGWWTKDDCEVRHGYVPLTELFTITKNTYY